jgi:hypothetical protein
MTIFLTVVVIIEGIAIYELWSRLKGESDRITKLGTALHTAETNTGNPEAAEIDRRYPRPE